MADQNLNPENPKILDQLKEEMVSVSVPNCWGSSVSGAKIASPSQVLWNLNVQSWS